MNIVEVEEKRIYINSILFGHTMYVNHKFSYRKKLSDPIKLHFPEQNPDYL